MKQRNKKKLCCMIHPHEGSRKCKECLVRKRTSYSTFRWAASQIRTVEDALIMIWSERDGCRGWRSQTTADKVKESIHQLSKDYGLDKIKIDIPEEIQDYA